MTDFNPDWLGPGAVVELTLPNLGACLREIQRLSNSISDTHSAGHILAMELLQSGAWDRLDDEARAAADRFLPKSLKAPEALK
jgi:hypothetical protein